MSLRQEFEASASHRVLLQLTRTRTTSDEDGDARLDDGQMRQGLADQLLV